MAIINVNYLGLNLKSPIVVSSCSLSEDIENIRIMEAAGAGAVVLFSLFEEQIHQEAKMFSSLEDQPLKSFKDPSDYFPSADEYHTSTEQYLDHIRAAKQMVDIPIIASLNGITPEGWVEYGKEIEKAGADAIEMNVFYIPVDLETPGSDVEARYVNIVKALKKNVSIPIAVKLNPYFSSMANMAIKLKAAGAGGLVLFNRFYEPDFDIDRMEVIPTLQYSTTHEIRLPLLWIGALYDRINVSLAATSGVQTVDEVIKFILAGSDVVMTASTLYQNGLGYINTMNEGLKAWMTRHKFKSVDEMRGLMSQNRIGDPTAYERANYLRVIGTERKVGPV
jgi:dihydroorotate dehydrogenase (fumarate)